MNALFNKLDFHTHKEESFAQLGGVFARLGDITNGLLYRGEPKKSKEP